MYAKWGHYLLTAPSKRCTYRGTHDSRYACYYACHYSYCYDSLRPVTAHLGTCWTHSPASTSRLPVLRTALESVRAASTFAALPTPCMPLHAVKEIPLYVTPTLSSCLHVTPPCCVALACVGPNRRLMRTATHTRLHGMPDLPMASKYRPSTG